MKSLQFSWGGDETGSDDQSDDQAEELEENSRENLVERLNNVEVLTTEAKVGAALDAATAEAEDVRSTTIKDNAAVLTIESSPEWGGTLIEEEQENAETEDIPSTSTANLEIPAP